MDIYIRKTFIFLNNILKMKIIKNNRDKVFWIFWFIWIFLGSILIELFNIETIIIHGIFIGIFTVIVLFDNFNKKFSDWLNNEV